MAASVQEGAPQMDNETRESGLVRSIHLQFPIQCFKITSVQLHPSLLQPHVTSLSISLGSAT